MWSYDSATEKCLLEIQTEKGWSLLGLLIGIGLVLATYVSGEGGALKYIILTLGVTVIIFLIWVQLFGDFEN